MRMAETTQKGLRGDANFFPRPIRALGCGVGAGCGAECQMSILIIGVVVAPIGSPRATSNWDGVRRAKLTNGFVVNTSGRPAYSFPSDLPLSLYEIGAHAKRECFLRHGSAPKRGWSANKSLQATRDGRFLRRPGYGGQASSAIADYVIRPACLSSGR
jgi:hypothetical protein